MTVNTREEAWKAVDEIFPTDYMENTYKSERAGYKVYESTALDCSAWISDLGNRLEINLENGETINVWIENDIVKVESEQKKLVERINNINKVAQQNFDRAQGMLEMLNEICGAKFGWFNKRVVIFANPDGSVAERYAEFHDAYCYLK